MLENYLVLILKELVILPNQEIKIELISNISKEIIKDASLNYNSNVLVLSPKDNFEEYPDVNDLPKIGVVAKIKSNISLSNGNSRVVLSGIKRYVVDEFYYDKTEFLQANVKNIDLPKFSLNEEKAIRRKLKSSLKKYVDNNSLVSNSILSFLDSSETLEKLTDVITIFLPFDKQKKQEYIEIINPLVRGKNLISDLEEEIEILKIEEEIESNLQIKIVEKEKEFLLREKLEEIKLALGENEVQEDYEYYLNRLNKLNFTKATRLKLEEVVFQYKNALKNSPETPIIKNYLDTLFSLPWENSKKEENNIKKINITLDKNHYGLTSVKNRIIEYVQIKNIKGKSTPPIICLVGPPGVGKSTIAYSIAKSLNREFQKISVAGLNDSSELLGNRKTYVGASYGKIIAAIKKAKVNNPIILIDEVDKMLKDYKGDPSSVLLDVLDYGLNKHFVDNYLAEEFSLENVIFILTANDIEDIPYPLLDRLEIFNINSYSVLEKIKIVNNYIVPKLNEFYDTDYKFNNNLIEKIIVNYTNEAGVRELERIFNKLIRNGIIHKFDKILTNETELILGKPKTKQIDYYNNNPGVSNFIATSYNGGILSKIEVSKVDGSGKVEATGLLDDVARESIKVAINYLKTEYNLKFDKIDIHVHFIENEINKTGSSAGVSIAAAILSLITNTPLSAHVAFTGEITLKGNILKVGGIKEKVVAAYNNNVKKLYLPVANKDDVFKLKEYIKNMEIIYINNFDVINKDLFDWQNYKK